MASLEHDEASGRFRVRFRFEEREFKRSLKTRERRAAETALARIEETIRLLENGRLELPAGADPGRWIVSDGKRTGKTAAKVTTVQELCDVYVENMPAGALEANSANTEALHRSHLLRIPGARKPLAPLTASDFQQYVNERAKEKYRERTIRAATIKKEVATFRAMWNWAVLQGYLTGRTPTKGLKYPKERQKPPFQTREEIERAIKRGGLTAEEIDELWDSLFLNREEIREVLGLVKERARFSFIYPMFCFIAYTGARRSEMIRSRVGDLLFDQRQVRIKEKKKDRSKEITYRHVDMADGLRGAMQEWFAGEHPGGIYTICQSLRTRMKVRENYMPLTINEANHHFHKTLKGTRWEGIRGFHVFRHSFASNMARAGVSSDVTDAFMGHQTEEMRKRYRHLFPDQRRQAVQAVFG